MGLSFTSPVKPDIYCLPLHIMHNICKMDTISHKKKKILPFGLTILNRSDQIMMVMFLGNVWNVETNTIFIRKYEVVSFCFTIQKWYFCSSTSVQMQGQNGSDFGQYLWSPILVLMANLDNWTIELSQLVY